MGVVGLRVNHAGGRSDRSAAASELGGESEKGAALRVVVIVICSVLLSLVAVSAHVRILGRSYLEENGEQMLRHVRVVTGVADDPYQYRVLSEYLVKGALWITRQLGIARPTLIGFIAFRTLENTLALVLAAVFYRALGLSTYTSLLGLTLLSWSTANATYDSDLAFIESRIHNGYI